MASVNFSEKEYEAVANAAMDAFRYPGRIEQARTLNALGAKMNKALSVAKYSGLPRLGHIVGRDWQAPGPIDAELGIKREKA